MNKLDQRQSLRLKFREQRRGLAKEVQARASRDIVNQFILLSYPAKRIASYLANDGELSLDKIHEYAWEQDMCVSLPVLHPFSKTHMLFLNYHQDTELKWNRFNIPEPKLDCTALIPVIEHDIILLPLVAFDCQGNRLGMGGGFYDRTLANLKNTTTKPLLVGIAHDCQMAEMLPAQNWDIPLDIILTPTKIIRTTAN